MLADDTGQGTRLRQNYLRMLSSPATAYAMNPVLMNAAVSRVGSGVYAWLVRFLLERFPEAAIRTFLQDEATLEKDEITALARRILTDPYRAAFVTQVWATRVRRVAERLPGTRNDLAQNATLTGLPLSDVACPVLIVQSPAPEPTRHAQHAAATLRQPELRWLRDGCHIGLWLTDDALEQQQYVLSWLRRKSGSSQMRV